MSAYASSTNACKLCTPLGACLAFHGLENTLSLLHGSQGCSTYIRRYMISHFREPMDIASTNFSEESAIYGGKENLKKALVNLQAQYQPQLIGLATTCLAETIGDDLEMFLREIVKELPPGSIPEIVRVSTASYRGTHADGYRAVGRALAEQIAQGGDPLPRVNLWAPMVSPQDLRHLMEITQAFGLDTTLVPDYSETLDGGSWESYQPIPPGGTSLDRIRDLGRGMASLEFGYRSLEPSGAQILESKFEVPRHLLPWPLGIRSTDLLFNELVELAHRPMPKKYRLQRQRLVDSYADGHKVVFGQKALVFGEEDLVLALCGFLSEIGIVPAVVATGADTGALTQGIKEVVPQDLLSEIKVLPDSDFSLMEKAAQEAGVTLIIGHSKGYKTSQTLKVPLIRIGFPIHDRFGGGRIRHLGYEGTQEIFDRIVNGILEKNQMENPVGYTYL